MENEHPIDFDSLQKGDVIPVERLEKITRTKHGTSEYQLAVLDLSKQIEKEKYLRGTPVFVVQQNSALRLLTDKEAVPYQQGRYNVGLRAAMRNFTKGQFINRSNLNDKEQKILDRNLYVQGRLLQALTSEREKLVLEGHKRTIPKLPFIENGNGCEESEELEE